jgi:hypothetical protein
MLHGRHHQHSDGEQHHHEAGEAEMLRREGKLRKPVLEKRLELKSEQDLCSEDQ